MDQITLLNTALGATVGEWGARIGNVGAIIGIAGGVFGSLLGLAGAYFGTRRSYLSARGPRERQAVVQGAAILGLFILGFMAVFFLLPTPYNFLSMVVYVPVLLVLMMVLFLRYNQSRRADEEMGD